MSKNFFPELASGKTWEIRNQELSRGSKVFPENSLAYVPVGDEVLARYYRNLAVVQTAISTQSIKNSGSEKLQVYLRAVELFMGNSAIKDFDEKSLDAGSPDLPFIQSLEAMDDEVKPYLFGLASWNTSAGKDFKKKNMSDRFVTKLSKCVSIIQDEFAADPLSLACLSSWKPFTDIQRNAVAAKIKKFLSNDDISDYDLNTGKKLENSEAQVLSDFINGMIRRPGSGTGSKPGGRPWPVDSDNNWGEMRIREDLPLNIVLRSNTALKWKKNYEGQVRFMHHWLSSGRAFGTRRRLKGGTVLLDCSGSMKPSTEKIREIVCNAPAVTVAGYCGDGRSGELCILARDGRMTDLDNWVRDSGNIIDGPALKWLSRQVRPLWWVSDGGVTGINDQSSFSLTSEVALFLSSNRHIRVAKTFTEAIRVFSQKKRR